MTDDQSARLRLAIRSHPIAWWEGFGCIVDKARKYRSAKRGAPASANEMQRHIVAVYRYCRKMKLPCRMIVLKPRQKGASTISTALLYHDLRNFVHKGCIIGDEYEKSVKNLLDMIKLYAAEDDFPWGNHFTEANGKFSHGSELVTETANDARAGASGTLQTLLATEVAHWKKKGAASADGVLLSIENCLPDLPDTLEVLESTPNGIGGAFYDRWQGAVDFEDFKRGVRGNGFVRVFAPWFAFADSVVELSQAEETALRTSLIREEQLLQTMHGLSLAQLAWRRATIQSKCGGDPDKFKQEYPSDATSCFLASGRQRFNVDGLAAWDDLAKKHHPAVGILTTPAAGWQSTGGRPAFIHTAANEGWMHRWEDPQVGARYLLAVDPARGDSMTTGKNPDCHAVGVIRAGWLDGSTGAWHRPRLVARVIGPDWPKQGCRVDTDVLRDFVVPLSRYYGCCTVVVENNAHGLALLELLKLEEDIPLYRERVYNLRDSKMTERLGFQNMDHSAGGERAGIRAMIIEALAAAIRDYDKPGSGLDVCCPHAVAECQTFVTKPNGKAEAMDGYHDDDVLMLAIGLHCLNEATTYGLPMASRQGPVDVLGGDIQWSFGGRQGGGGQYS